MKIFRSKNQHFQSLGPLYYFNSDLWLNVDIRQAGCSFKGQNTPDIFPPRRQLL